MHDDLQLFQKIAEGDEVAFAEVFHRYTPHLLSFIKKLTRSEQAASELIQETFMHLWMQRSQLKQVENPSAWIYRIASNISINYLKNKANRKQLLVKIKPAESSPIPDDLFEIKELTQVIQNSIKQLPERRQEIYQLSREEGLSHQQIADKLNISSNTVKNQIGTALKFIQEAINKQRNLPVITLPLLLLLKIFFYIA